MNHDGWRTAHGSWRTAHDTAQRLTTGSLMRRLTAALIAVSLARTAAAQDFRPPDQRRPEDAPVSEAGCFCMGLFGFSTRGGGQVTKDEQAVIGSTLDIAQLGSPQVRLRAVGEVGFGRPEQSIGTDLEILWRFQPDRAPAIPYLGLGVGYYDDGAVDHVWPTVVFGFELRYRGSTHWLIEYHALEGLNRSRFLIGLATSIGSR